MHLIKAAKYIICAYILFIISYVELILSDTSKKFQSPLVLYWKLTVISNSNGMTLSAINDKFDEW